MFLERHNNQIYLKDDYEKFLEKRRYSQKLLRHNLLMNPLMPRSSISIQTSSRLYVSTKAGANAVCECEFASLIIRVTILCIRLSKMMKNNSLNNANLLSGRVVKTQRYESTNEDMTSRNHSLQANSQLSCPSSGRSVNEYSDRIRGSQRQPAGPHQLHSCQKTQPA